MVGYATALNYFLVKGDRPSTKRSNWRYWNVGGLNSMDYFNGARIFVILPLPTENYKSQSPKILPLPLGLDKSYFFPLPDQR